MITICKTIGCRNPAYLGLDYCMECAVVISALPLLSRETPIQDKESEYTGSSVSYYTVLVSDPMSGNDPYMAECGDIIEALGMDFNEGNAFKAIWRRCAARTLGKAKKGYTDGVYDAEKVVYFGERMLATEQRKQRKSPTSND